MKELWLNRFAIILVNILTYLECYATVPYNGCPDFTNLNADYVEAYAGKKGGEDIDSVVYGRHTVITTNGNDGNTGNALHLIPEGESEVVRLGNYNAGAEKESLTYNFIPQEDKPILLIGFSVVFQNPGHSILDQPFFLLQVFDKDGNILDDCLNYQVYG